MNSERLLARLILRNALSKRTMASHGRRHPPATMNDLPVPQGDFFVRHAANQRRYNTILAAGILSVVSGLYAWTQANVMSLNFSPPDTYE
ncbi:uncharacterized protein [Chironomus tepperi]|uniref:uncharacterized protein n=1 Tax=Chironomus tepperi TaxID=113505 RepID=UPI00391F76AA